MVRGMTHLNRIRGKHFGRESALRSRLHIVTYFIRLRSLFQGFCTGFCTVGGKRQVR